MILKNKKVRNGSKGIALTTSIGAIIAVGVLIFVYGLLNYIPGLGDDIRAFVDNLFGGGGVIGPVSENLVNAMKCAYYRCTEGCESSKITGLSIDNKNCKTDYCDQYEDIYGRVCGENSIYHPIVTSVEDGLTIAKSDFEKIGCMYSFEWMENCGEEGNSYLGEACGNPDNPTVCPLSTSENDPDYPAIAIPFEYISDPDSLETEACGGHSNFGDTHVFKKAKMVGKIYYIWSRTNNFDEPCEGYYDCRLDMVMCENKPEPQGEILNPGELSDKINAGGTLRRVIIKDDENVIDWFKFKRSGNNFMLTCSDSSEHTESISTGKSATICNDKFMIERTDSGKIKVRYVSTEKRIIFSPKEVAVGDSTISIADVDSSYSVGDTLSLIKDSCSGSDVLDECTVSVTYDGGTPHYECDLSVTPEVGYKDTILYLVLCDGTDPTGHAGILTVLDAYTCECNAANTGCERTNCEGCAKCGPDGSSPICYDGEWKNSISYPDYSTYGSCCIYVDCQDTKCIFDGGLGVWKHLTIPNCEDTVCSYWEQLCTSSCDPEYGCDI